MAAVRSRVRRDGAGRGEAGIADGRMTCVVGCNYDKEVAYILPLLRDICNVNMWLASSVLFVGLVLGSAGVAGWVLSIVDGINSDCASAWASVGCLGFGHSWPAVAVGARNLGSTLFADRDDQWFAIVACSCIRETPQPTADAAVRCCFVVAGGGSFNLAS